MTIKPLTKVLAALALGLSMMGANAASIGFDQSLYIANPGDEIAVTINYDFTDTAIFGGGLNVIYDASVLQFISYTPATWGGTGEPQSGAASPVGALTADGAYEGIGIGTFDFNGINTAGQIGTFQFLVLGAGGDAGCGQTLCLTPVEPANPFGSTTGQNLNPIVFDPNGDSVLGATVVPVPAAVWFLLSGLGALFGLGRRKA